MTHSQVGDVLCNLLVEPARLFFAQCVQEQLRLHAVDKTRPVSLRAVAVTGLEHTADSRAQSCCSAVSLQ